MADQWQLALLRESVEKWNVWRKADVEVQVDLAGANLRQANLSGADLTGVDLRGANFTRASLHEANLEGANLEGACLRWARLKLATLARANLTRADLWQTDLNEANLRQANLSEADLTGVNLSSTMLRSAILVHARLSRANLREASLTGTDLTRANLREADLSKANLSKADLSKADLSKADLSGTNLTRANLTEADLSGTNLTEADLSDADLTRAILTGIKCDVPFPQEIPFPHRPSVAEWATIGMNVLTLAATLASIIQGLDIIERRWRGERQDKSQQAKQKGRSSEQEIVGILLVMHDGSQHSFNRWLSNPDALRAYIDAFSDPDSTSRPYQVIFKMLTGLPLVVNVSKDGKDNRQLNEILGYLEDDAH